jgi:hypothetical protein
MQGCAVQGGTGLFDLIASSFETRNSLRANGVSHADGRSCFVSGHDFSRAVSAPK